MSNIDYSKYYWQNELVRFAPYKPEDWEEHYYDRFDSQARFFLQCQIEIPVSASHDQESYKKMDMSDNTGNVGFVIETLDGDVIGGIGLSSVDQRNGSFSIALRINHQKRGKGYGTAALKLMLDYAFNERRLHKFNADLIEGNVPSESMLIKIGCKKEGVRREVIYHEGRYWNQLYYGLTAGEFRNNR